MYLMYTMKQEITNNTEDLTYSCSSANAGLALNPTLIYFTITRDIAQVQTEASDAESGEGGGTEEGMVYNQPVPYASIEPVVNGIMSDEETDNPNSPLIDGVRVPIRYQGIATPSSDWCSDSCGVVGVEVAFRCPAAGETAQNTVQIHSGALFSKPVNINVTTEE